MGRVYHKTAWVSGYVPGCLNPADINAHCLVVLDVFIVVEFTHGSEHQICVVLVEWLVDNIHCVGRHITNKDRLIKQSDDTQLQLLWSVQVTELQIGGKNCVITDLCIE